MILREYSTKNPHMHPVFQYFIDRTPKQFNLSVDQILSGTKDKIPRGDVIQLCRVLDQLNLANFVAGRRSAPSRLIFYNTPESIGKVALGRASKFVKLVRSETYINKPPHSAKFHVQTGPAGTTFALPTDASPEDARQLARFIREQYNKRA